jgi:hypothetical protein
LVPTGGAVLLLKTGQIPLAQGRAGDISEKVNGDNLSVPMIEVYLKDRLKLIGARIKPTTLIHYEGTLTKFLARWGARARQAVTSLTPQDLERFHETDVPFAPAQFHFGAGERRHFRGGA